jgi:carbon storage regulator
MLVLTRKVGERIVVGGDVTITLLSCSGGRVRLGIDPPGEAKVMRAALPERRHCAGVGGEAQGPSHSRTPGPGSS